MRLTLRTLLAYRDRVLNPAELEDMHGRVQQSAMASNLVKRIESLSQRTNILAPPIEGSGLGADANSIAEYLDDTLKGDKVPELERICLESDVQLAELAQCHTLLSAALSTAVEVPGNLRQRVVSLSDEAVRAQALARRHSEARGEAPSETQPAARSDAQDNVASTHATPTNRLPESERHVTPNGATRFRTDEPHTDLPANAPESESTNGKATKGKQRELVPAQAVTAPMMASGGDSIRPSGLDLEGSHLAHEVPEYLRGRSRDGWLGPVAIGGLVCLLCLLVWQSVGSWSSVRDMFTLAPKTADPNAPAPSAPSNASGAEKGKGDANANILPSSDAASRPANQAANDALPKLPSGEQQDPANPPRRAPANDTVIDKSNPATDKANGTTADASADSAGSIAQAAQWLPVDASSMQAVLLVQAGGAALHRLQPSESIPSGSQIFVPSANRPKLDLIGGPQWQVCGTTHALLIRPDVGSTEGGSTAEPQVDLRLGRAVLVGSASGSGLALVTPAGKVRLTVGNGASMAIEVNYQPVSHGPVNNRAAYLPTLAVFGLEGESSIQLENQSSNLKPGDRVVLQSGQVKPAEPAEAPLWIDSNFDRPVDVVAAADLSKELANSVAIGDALQKLATNRRPETRALAAQTLSLLGSWEWVTQPKSALNDVKDRSFWTALLERTRQILAAHPENVDALAASLEQLDPSTAKWRLMLWLGLDAAQLQADGSQKILASLEHEALIERILAIQQLQRATGKDLGYQAGEPNRTIVSQWSRELSTGKISFLPAPKS